MTSTLKCYAIFRNFTTTTTKRWDRQHLLHWMGEQRSMWWHVFLSHFAHKRQPFAHACIIYRQWTEKRNTFEPRQLGHNENTQQKWKRMTFMHCVRFIVHFMYFLLFRLCIFFVRSYATLFPFLYCASFLFPFFTNLFRETSPA